MKNGTVRGCREHGAFIECSDCREESFCPGCGLCWRTSTGFCIPAAIHCPPVELADDEEIPF